jgi:isocitrate dehydrogenase
MTNLLKTITMNAGSLQVPNTITIPFISGDGIGPEVTKATQKIIMHAVEIAYHSQKNIIWKEVLAGEKAYRKTGEWLPQETLDSFKKYLIGMKGPLTTPVGEGIRSLNVALRKDLDLYACLRPVRYFDGIVSPVKNPEKIDITIFRENTEDVYTGIEFNADSSQANSFLDWLRSFSPTDYQKIRFPNQVGIGFKPISRHGSERLLRAALDFANDNNKPVVTLVHKGNIMKFTEGAFRNWGYDLAEKEYSETVYSARQYEKTKKSDGIQIAEKEKETSLKNGKIWLNDVIADAAFQNLLLYPEKFSVIATTNLNGDYISDALAAQVGGIGIAPGANINYETGVAIFEATHGTAPDIAGKNLANPSSLILSSVLMLDYIGWHAAAQLITNALAKTIKQGQLTQDLAQFVSGSTGLGTTQFADKVIENFETL